MKQNRKQLCQLPTIMYKITPTPPPNYLAIAILSTIFCCLPTGIISIIYAAQVNSKWTSDDFTGAQIASNNAKTWAIVSIVIGIFVGIGSFILSALGILFPFLLAVIGLNM